MPHVRRADPLVFELHVVVHYDVCHHRLQLVRGEESSGAAKSTPCVSQCVSVSQQRRVPSVFAVSKRHIVERRAHELVLERAALLLAHVREPPRVEDLGVRVVVLVQVRRRRGGDHERVRREDRAV